MTLSEIPESRVLLVFLLLVDMLISIVRESITIADGDERSGAVAAMSIFGVVGLLFLVAYSIAVVIYVVFLFLDSWSDSGTDGQDKRTKATFKAVSLIIGVIGSGLYLYGDNLSFVIQNAMVLDCDESCILNNRVAAFICLGLALIIFHMIPPILHQTLNFALNKASSSEENPWLVAINMIAVIVKTDMLYSAVLQITNIDFCSTGGEVISWVFVWMCIAFATGALVVNCLHAVVANDGHSNYLLPFAVFGLFVLFICLPLYMLSDNTYPLDCHFGCSPEIEAQNITLAGVLQNTTTTSDLVCDQVANSGLRLGFTLVSFVVITALSIIYTAFAWSSTGQDPTAAPI